MANRDTGAHAKDSNCITEDIVISGISGRFPESDSIEEFKKHLLDGKDLVTDDERRWPSGLYGLPTRSGKIKDLNKFDAKFFGVHAKQADAMDPQLRLLLETTFEALVDAGVNPSEVRGSRTGVFIGCSESETKEYWSKLDPEEVNGYGLLGNASAMFANRLSYTFDFIGPSHAIDTACSSSLVAFQRGVSAIKTGECDAAVVGGSNLCLRATAALQLCRSDMLSVEGKCKTFDATANGYARSEAVGIIYLQKINAARRVYATVLGAKVNTDGFKNEGITHPSGNMQNQLMRELYTELGINPVDVSYIEAHGTGTKVEDPQEANSIADLFCENRKEPLLIGSVKTNMGHSETASGIASLAKLVIAMESGVIPANLHYKQPHPDIPALSDGRLKVVSKNEMWNGGLVAVNSFGFGGANAHVLLRSNAKPKTTTPPEPLPRLVAISGCSENAVNKLFDQVQAHRDDEEFLALLNQLHSSNIAGHGYRGYSILGKDIQQTLKVYVDKRPIWYVFSGMGSQWPGMAKHLMQLEVFKNSIIRSARTLKPHGVNLEDILVNSDEIVFENVINSSTAIAAMQVALTDVLKSVGIEPDGVVGHSSGEIGCAYADGSFTLEQAIMVSYYRGRAILDSELPEGAMAAVGLSWEECKKRCPPEIIPACHNSADSVTVSGPPEAINEFVSKLKDEGIFAKAVNSSGAAFHSKYIAEAGPKCQKALNDIIPNPKLRTNKWISSSIPEAAWNTPLAQFSSAAYQANNLLSPVLFHEAIQHIPENAIVIEIAPHGLLQSILKRALGPNATNIFLSKKDHVNNMQFLLSSIGELYVAGGQPKICNLYQPVSFPVSRGTPMINSMIEWDHSEDWTVADFSKKGARSGEDIIIVNVGKEDYKFLTGHEIDGQVLFPATGYLTLAWKTMAKLRGEDFEKVPVKMEDVQFHRPTIMPHDSDVKFLINIMEGSGEFEICESGSVVASGKISVPEDVTKEVLVLPILSTKYESDLLSLNTSDVYKEFRLRGYDYSGLFQGITESDNRINNGKLKWNGNWISFLDTVFQFYVVGQTTQELYLPMRLQRIIINPMGHIAHISQLSKNDNIYVHMYKNLDIIKSGGVEIRGMTLSSVPRRQLAHTKPEFVTYQYIPFHYTIQMEDIMKSRYQALTISVHTILSNSAGATKIQIMEVATERPSETILSTLIKDILETEPTITVEYTIISDAITDATEFENTGVKVISKDVSNVQFEQSIHVVVLVDVVALRKLDIIQNVMGLLTVGGFILLEEREKYPDCKIIARTGLEIVSIQATRTKTYILLRKPIEVSTNAVVLNITDRNFTWIEPLRHALKKSETDGTKVYLIGHGEELSGLVRMVNCIIKEPGGLNVRAYYIKDKTDTFSLTSPLYINQVKQDLVQNVFQNKMWGSYHHLPLVQQADNEYVQVENAYINTLNRGDLTSLKWIEAPFSYYKSDKLTELCHVYYAPLNVRDIMLATGKLPPDALPGNLAGQECIMGLEFSGRDSKGQRVMGIVNAKSLATTCIVDPQFLWKVPEKWSLEEAATIPVVYGTSYYALIVVGKLQPRETILIHAGAGGVGQASIAIALHLGCDVFTTVGSQVKKDFLKKTFPQLKECHIGNSRDTSFEQWILTQTGGSGVDMVLNSLTGELLQASVRCLAMGGRFLEIGKVDLLNNSTLKMNVFLKNTTFFGIFIDELWERNDPNKNKIITLITEGIASGAVRPLPSIVFGKNQVEEAFRFMASGKHIGKVMLKIRNEESREIQLPTPITINAIARTYMNPHKIYVLVGGLGEFGLELANWLILRGATKIMLTSRSGVKTGYQSRCVRRWREKGVKILISTIDVTTENGAKKLLTEANKVGPVGGIFNLAVVLRGAMMENQSEADFNIVTEAKINSTKHLDSASRVLVPHLDYFVAFSSISCSRGNAGQINYGLANSAIEHICKARQAAGLPGLVIQWEAIREVSRILEIMGNNDIALGGTLPQLMVSCLSTIDTFMQRPHAVVSSTYRSCREKTLC